MEIWKLMQIFKYLGIFQVEAEHQVKEGCYAGGEPHVTHDAFLLDPELKQVRLI